MANPSIRQALYGKLQATSALTTLLPDGAGGIYDSRLLRSTARLPAVMIRSASGHPLGPVDAYELWDVRVYDADGNSYYAIEQALLVVKQTLADTSLSLASGSGMGVIRLHWVLESADDFDLVLNLPYQFHRFRAYVTRLN